MNCQRMWLAAPVAAVVMSFGGVAGAAPSDYVGPTTTVCAPPCAEERGEDVDTTDGDPGGRGRDGARDGAGGGLPVTGGDVAGLAVVGFGLLAVGSVLVRGSHRRTV